MKTSARSHSRPEASTIAIDARKLADFGIGTYLRGLLGALGRLDRESRYLLLAPRAGRELVPDLPQNFHWVEEDAPGYSLREQWSVGQQLVHHRPDLFHSPHYVLPLRTPMRVVVTIHDLIHLVFPEFLPGRLALPYARYFLRRAVRRADRILTVSAATAADLEHRLGVPPSRIDVIWNGVDDAFRRRLGAAELATELGQLGLVPGYFLSLGNPKPHKNLERVVRAFARLPADGPRLVIAGAPEGSESTDEIAAWAQELHLKERLVRIGRIASERLPALVQGAVALVFPSLYEGFGLPLVEAMASGTPVVASTTPALVEIAGGAAELVDPLDVGAIADGLARLAGDPGPRLELAQAGLARSEAFRWESTAEKTLAVYRRVLS
ncbi:MAG: glycosyltransferase family 1 protein, partial [Thermoanaerobaculia bacterium]